MTWASTVIEQAIAGANRAINEEIACNGPEDMNAMDCGFAWVHVPDGRCKFVKECRQELSRRRIQPNGNMPGPAMYGTAERYQEALEASRKFGSKHHKRGWEFWGVGHFNGQAVRIKEAGARGFANVLREHGIECVVGSRLD